VVSGLVRDSIDTIGPSAMNFEDTSIAALR